MFLQLLKCRSGSFGSITAKCLSFLFVIFETNMEEVMGKWAWKLCTRISKVKIKMGLHMMKIDLMRIRSVQKSLQSCLDTVLVLVKWMCEVFFWYAAWSVFSDEKQWFSVIQSDYYFYYYIKHNLYSLPSVICNFEFSLLHHTFSWHHLFPF